MAYLYQWNFKKKPQLKLNLKVSVIFKEVQNKVSK